jgi:alkanesulfonate monooxygenase
MPVEFIGMISTKDQSETRLSRGPVIEDAPGGSFAPTRTVRPVLIGWRPSQPDGTQVVAHAAGHSERPGFLVATPRLHRPDPGRPPVATLTS